MKSRKYVYLSKKIFALVRTVAFSLDHNKMTNLIIIIVFFITRGIPSYNNFAHHIVGILIIIMISKDGIMRWKLSFGEMSYTYKEHLVWYVCTKNWEAIIWRCCSVFLAQTQCGASMSLRKCVLILDALS